MHIKRKSSKNNVNDIWAAVSFDFFREYLAPLSASAFKVYICLLLHAPIYQKGPWLSGINPSLRTIADEVNLSVNTVQAALSELEAAGIVIITRRPRKSNKYRLLRASVSEFDTKKNASVSNSDNKEDKNKKGKENPNPKDHSDYQDRKPDATVKKGQDFSACVEKEEKKTDPPRIECKPPRVKDPWNPQEPVPIRNLIPQIPKPAPTQESPFEEKDDDDRTEKRTAAPAPVPTRNLDHPPAWLPAFPIDPAIEQEIAANCPRIKIPDALNAVRWHAWTLEEVQALIYLKKQDPSVRDLDSLILARLRSGRRLEDWEPASLERKKAKLRAQQEKENRARRQWERARQERLEAEEIRRRRQFEDQRVKAILGKLPQEAYRQIEQQARLNLSRENGLPPRIQLKQLIEPEMLRILEQERCAVPI